MLIVIVEK
jgi:hypothetical protein